MRLNDITCAAIDRVRFQAWQSIVEKASDFITCQKDIRDRFEIIEQEKVVLEEEFGNAITLNEDL